ncbi:NAD(P)H-dependent oxidoreductase [Aliiroseovarius sp. F47248L]|uniref:FMN-dependent NADH-azoreductase n=1 Tax=Aliiroseovarius sp. F47248L TaxID=2926420 RepID=UPI001FF655A7|nr:NAD(P)H-dependent oxidoreductase [Aliiroseovarius sp. F47248L]MCK0137757.1 NAD(P)H-dependent oxidoreductase [Aliiroseovarius sp. F47248L]
MTHILRIDSSARADGSISRALADKVIAKYSDATVTTRDLAQGVPHLTAAWTAATFTPPEARTEDDNAALDLSDQIVAEVQQAELIVISAATYNFSIPSTLKAWIDQLARAGVTFRYREDGTPEGLLTGKRVIVVTASAGTPVGAPHDFATPYLKFILGFLGMTDVDFISATGPDGLSEADASIEKLAA